MAAITFDFKLFLKTAPTRPGVYCMRNISGSVIYVGKAKDLKKRLASYFYHRSDQHDRCRKTESLVATIASIDLTVTHTETEALLLENNHIKQYQPRYNVLLRDDTAYPSILLTTDQYPRLVCHRGAKRTAGEYFGPFPNSWAVHETLTLLQKIFPLRQCENSAYRNRSRPCLQYQIGRCLGPCVPGLVSEAAYQQQVNYVRLFLQGKDRQVITMLINRMEAASQALQFETAAKLRDQIQAIQQVVKKQFVTSSHDKMVDAVSIAYEAGIACVQVLFLRHGKLLGGSSYFPKVPKETTLNEIAQTFISQFYLQDQQTRSLPEQILVDFPLPGSRQLARLLRNILGQKLQIYSNPRGDRARYLQLAHTNALTALQGKLAHRTTIQQRFQALAQVLNLSKISRLECVDISHTLGQQTVASCVVFDTDGPLKSEYRCYNITDVVPGDDCAAISQALKRRYCKKIDPEKIPDVVLVDGGKGQLNAALQVFSNRAYCSDGRQPCLVSIAKGEARKPGLETLFIAPTGNGIKLPPTSVALHLVQHIRDEAHRHALTGHRRRRSKIRTTSVLQQITGIGQKRRQSLLKYLGGLQPLLSATVEEIAAVPMMSNKLAEKVYQALRR